MKNKWILLPVAAALLLTSCQSASGAAVYRNNPLELAQRVGQTVQKSTEIHLSADLRNPRRRNRFLLAYTILRPIKSAI